MHSISNARQQLQQKLFPQGIPRLWCPSLTHFSAAAQFDVQRIRAHVTAMSPWIGGLLVPGSTGEGWEMTDDDIEQLLKITFDIAHSLNLPVLIGVLKTSTDNVISGIQRLHQFSQHPCFAGFTVCPPQGEQLTQPEILAGLRSVFDTGYPIALYQLPQVTRNEVSPETVQWLAANYHNLILFKDTSGHDRVATSGVDLQGVFLVRGAEAGGYAHWLKESGGAYDGFLLSTANVFAKELATMIQLAEAGQIDEARARSTRLETLVQQTFDSVISIPAGNPFTNANKVLDHIRAYGESFHIQPAPLLYSGVSLPWEPIAQAHERLKEWQQAPLTGYLNTQ